MVNSVRAMVLTAMGLLSVMAYGQLGAKAGLGIASWTWNENDVNVSQELVNAGFGFRTGMGYEIVLGDIVSFEPAVLFTQRAFSLEATNASPFIKYKLLSLEIPLNVKVYFVDLGDQAQLYALGGGYLGYIFSGKANGQKLNIGTKSNDFFKPLDAGINIGAGVKLFDSLNVDLSGGLGIANLTNDQSNGRVFRLNVIQLTATYQFGG